MPPQPKPQKTALRGHRVTPGQRKQKRHPTPRGTETRSLVIEAAVECICKEGFAATTMKRIAARAGVTWGVMQYHFGDRGGHLTVRLQEIEIQGDDLQERVQGLVDIGWEIFGAPIARACFEIILATRSEMTPRSASKDRLMVVAKELNENSDRLLAQTLRQKQPPKKAQRVFVAALRGFTFEVMQYPSNYDYKREREALTDVLTAYLQTLEKN
ncbi:MAG: TetR/AcrR family transcriptional regulator [Deltaproteobacteria bacterium]|nr:TetR/AcrR family transcriptional regulator [Deltaproteobacteria bacterium]